VIALLHLLLHRHPEDTVVKKQEYGNDAVIEKARDASSVVDSSEALVMSMTKAMWLLMKATEEAGQGSRSAGHIGTVLLTEAVMVIFYHRRCAHAL